MNPENPTDPREALEPSLTALLLGELPEDQARFVRQAIATDPELAKTFERLKQASDLIRETQVRPVTDAAAPPAAPKLGEARRQQLLAQFKTVQPAQFNPPAPSRFSRLISVAAAIALMMVVAAALLPALSRSKSRSFAQRRLLDSDDLVKRNVTTTASGAVTWQLPAAKPVDQLGVDLLRPKQQPATESESVRGLERAERQPRTGSSSRPTIVLPTTDKEGLLSLSDALGRDEKDPASTVQPPIASATAVPEFNLQPTPATLQYNGTIGGLAGGPGPAQQQVPSLGDVPLLGGRFMSAAKDREESSAHKTDDTLQQRLQKEKLAVPEPLQVSKLDSSFGDEAFRSRYGMAAQGVKKIDGATTSYFGAAAEQASATNFASDGKSLLPAEAPSPVVGSNMGKSEVLLDPESGQKVALAGIDQAKEPAGNLVANNEPAAVGLKVEELKPQAGRAEKGKRSSVSAEARIDREDLGAAKPALTAPVPQPEVQTRENALSTFSLNVSDVSFKLAAASLEKGVLPEPAAIRSEEFINAFDYRDPAPVAGQPLGFASDHAQYPFAQNREILRFSIKTGAAGRTQGQPLNLVLLLDNSGSMERADRVRIIHEALRVLATQLQARDTFSVVTFARSARLWVDGVPGNQAGRVAEELSALTPEGGTNLEEAMNLAYQTALRHYAANGINRVVLLTDGAANLGDTEPDALKKKVESNRKQGVAFDCFGIGWEGYNDDLLEVLTRNGDGRYGFLNTPEAAATEFAGELAGALRVAASDVKAQVEFNTNRVTAYRQVGYARHQLTQEQFRDNTVDAAEIGAAESGNALYVVETNPQGEGPLATVRVRYKVPGTAEYREQEWAVPFNGVAASLPQASPAMRLATTAASFSEWLANSPYAAEVTTDRLLGYLNGVSAVYGADPRPQKLEWMIRQAKALSGK